MNNKIESGSGGGSQIPVSQDKLDNISDNLKILGSILMSIAGIISLIALLRKKR